MDLLQRIQIRGFRSLRDVDLELRPLNVLIGANGSGKSNLVALFALLYELVRGRLQNHLAATGRAHSNLFLGTRVTSNIEVHLEFQGANGTGVYFCKLSLAPEDTLFFDEERVSVQLDGAASPASYKLGGSGHLESRLDHSASWNDLNPFVVRSLLEDCRPYHFHDTSPTARVRQSCFRGDRSELLPDAANLAGLLLGLKESRDPSYARIVGTVRLIAPFFDDFEFITNGPNDQTVSLGWRQIGSDELFGPHQLSDGTLRAICLMTLLLQPKSRLPGLIIVDEPELGLHPYAINIIASLFKATALERQVLITTQSTAFLDCFDPVDVIVSDRRGHESQFARLNAEELSGWLEDYNLGEIWEKNIIGGGPR